MRARHRLSLVAGAVLVAAGGWSVTHAGGPRPHVAAPQRGGADAGPGRARSAVGAPPPVPPAYPVTAVFGRTVALRPPATAQGPFVEGGALPSHAPPTGTAESG